LAQLAAATSIPLCASETLGGSAARFADVISRTDCRHIMYDLGWLGGISVAREVAVLADAAELPTSTHSQGPVQFAASAHLAVHCPGCELVELVRAAYYGYYQVVLEELPPVEAGFVSALRGPGLGTKLRNDFLASDDVAIRRSAL
jgi:L-alanine-DL-glutamate epimerase-like enolase superfamily enzyme